MSDVDVYPVATLAEIVRALAMPETLPPLPHDITMLQPGETHVLHDFADVRGRAAVKRALEVAAYERQQEAAS